MLGEADSFRRLICLLRCSVPRGSDARAGVTLSGGLEYKPGKKHTGQRNYHQYIIEQHNIDLALKFALWSIEFSVLSRLIGLEQIREDIALLASFHCS
jgi:hypothetical protein